jgi:hypothetical protein
VATISGTTVTILSAGTSTITANQTADGNYTSASITATLTVTDIAVLTNTGAISSTNLNYVNQYGQIGGDFGLSANGAIVNAKTLQPIVSAGLVLHLDAGNTSSYTGTGTTWTDISGNGNHGNLQNGVTFNNANDGSLVFDGLNDFFVTNSNLDLSNTDKLTIQIILKTAAVNEEMIMEHSVDWNTNNSFGIISKNNKMQITDHNQSYNVSNSVDSINDNNWHLLSATTDRSLSAADQNLIYIDGKAANKVNVANLSNDNSGNFTSHKLYISSRAGSSYFFNGAIAQVLIYNRVLTAAEIQQNYNAVKLKYGL